MQDGLPSRSGEGALSNGGPPAPDGPGAARAKRHRCIPADREARWRARPVEGQHTERVPCRTSQFGRSDHIRFCQTKYHAENEFTRLPYGARDGVHMRRLGRGHHGHAGRRCEDENYESADRCAGQVCLVLSHFSHFPLFPLLRSFVQ